MNVSPKLTRRLAALACIMGLSLWSASGVLAHCDSVDGPIIPEARRALAAGDIAPILKWVSAEHEGEIRDAFAQTRELRERGEDVSRMAERHFLETLIRVHRQGEGAPYTGLKPAGHIDPAFVAADAALEHGEIDKLADEISAAVHDAIHERFAAAHAGLQHADHSVEAGREYVAAYVSYIHYIEGLHGYLAAGQGQGGAPACGGHAE